LAGPPRVRLIAASCPPAMLVANDQPPENEDTARVACGSEATASAYRCYRCRDGTVGLCGWPAIPASGFGVAGAVARDGRHRGDLAGIGLVAWLQRSAIG